MKKYYILILILGLQVFSFGQTATVSTPLLPIENINVFTDRDIYLSGETIWFSATVSLENHQESLSKLLYIELFNADQRSIVKKKYSINQGIAEGALDIPSEFLSDVYYLRAYTPYNKNFPVEQYFLTALQIVNPRKGIPFKKGVDEDQNEIKIHPSNPYSIKTLQAKQGMHLVSIYKSQKEEKTDNGLVIIELVNNHHQIISRAEFILTSKPSLVAFPNSLFSNSGFYYYLLKNQAKKILKVHAFLYQDSSRANFLTEMPKSEFIQRSAVSLDLSKIIPNNHSHLGIKIVQKGSILSSKDKFKLFIKDPYLLFSFLRTQFNPMVLNTREVDTILLALNEKLDLEEYQNLFYTSDVSELKWIPGLKNKGLSGILLNKHSQKPLANNPIYLSIFDTHPEIYVATSNNDGSFQFAITNYEHNKDALLCPIFDKSDETEIKINEEFTLSFPNFKAIPLSTESLSLPLLEQMLFSYHFSKTLKIKSKNQDFSIFNLPFSFDDPKLSIVLANYIETPTLEMVFKELIPSVRVRKHKDSYKLSVVDFENDRLYKNPLILVDDVPVFNLDELLKIPPKVVEKIAVHYTPFYMNNYTINGIVMITTNTDNLGGMTIPKSTRFFEYQTLSPAYIFNSKTYNSVEDINSRIGDFRTLLYWEPFIQNESKQSLYFSTSDQTGDYETFIFGTYKNGQAFHLKAFDFKVID